MKRRRGYAGLLIPALAVALIIAAGIFSQPIIEREVGDVFKGNHRKLLQSEGTVLSTPIPINWGIFWEAPLYIFNLYSPVVNATISQFSNFMALEGIQLNLFGDFPVAGLRIPKFNLFQGRGYNPFLEDVVSVPGARVVQLTSWLQFSFFNFNAFEPGFRFNIWRTFGWEDLGLPEGFANVYTTPYSGDGLARVDLIEESFISWAASLLLELLGAVTYNPGFYGVNFTSI